MTQIEPVDARAAVVATYVTKLLVKPVVRIRNIFPITCQSTYWGPTAGSFKIWPGSMLIEMSTFMTRVFFKRPLPPFLQGDSGGAVRSGSPRNTSNHRITTVFAALPLLRPLCDAPCA